MRRPLGVTIGVILLIVSGVFSILIGLEVTKVTNFGLATALALANVQGYGAIFSGILTLAISLGLWITLLSYLISIPLGIRKAVKDGSAFDVWTSGVVIIGYAVLVGSRSYWFHAIGAGSIALVVGLALVVLVDLIYPFSGDLSVGPDAFHTGVLAQFFPA